MRISSRKRALLLAGLFVLAVGCATTTVRKNPGQHDRGLRYYRPKPYLLIDRAKKGELDDQGLVKGFEYVNGMVDIKLEWLPDFSEEYSIHVRTGIGTNTTDVTLTDGWRLDKIDVNVDSKATEFVEQLTKLISTEPKLLAGLKKLPGKGGGVGDEGSNTGEKMELRVCAHDVPIGYYEAIVTKGADGKKRLYGWRYVGFAPFANCPIEMAGSTTDNCQATEMFGLVSIGNQMYFKKLNELGTQPKMVSPLPPPAVPKKGAQPDTGPMEQKKGTQPDTAMVPK